jgi:phosphoglycolate phosphatase
MNDISFPRAVIFDWDGTLVDSYRSIAESMNVTRAAFGQEAWTFEEARKRCNRALNDSFPEWFGTAWERARDIYRNHFSSIHLKNMAVLPGAEELVRFLAGAGAPLFVVSNKHGDLLRPEVKALGWEAYFAGVVGASDAPRDKPHRDPVDFALQRAGMLADDPAIWFVGDTWVDVQCARASGCTPVLVHDMEEAARLGVGMAFSDCHALRSLLYRQGNNKTP